MTLVSLNVNNTIITTLVSFNQFLFKIFVIKLSEVLKSEKGLAVLNTKSPPYSRNKDGHRREGKRQ